VRDRAAADSRLEREPAHRGYEDMSEDQLTFLRSVKLDDEEVLDDMPEHDFDEASSLMDVVGVKLHTSGPVILFDCQDMYLDQGDKVVVETGRGLALGEVLVPARRRLMRGEKLPRVIRKATSSDKRQQQRNEDREDAAYRLCKDRIERLGLPMKLVKVEYLHGGNKAVFYFSADGRIDFRELVRDLAKRLHTRIEMRQIGVRDASRMLGGVGACGCQLCCNLYLREFQPVSIRMAKDQNLILNPQKVSGICGRLLCCLIYEDEAYRETAKGMPRVGRRVTTPDGEGRIRDRDVLRRIVRVQLNEEAAVREYPLDKIQLPSKDDGEIEPEPELDIPEDAGTIPEE
jgi:cell fate regulator YaaT (PSP1 superfamily)